MNDHNLYKDIEQYAKSLFAERAKPALLFHNLKHTEAVVDRTKEIAAHYNLSEKDMLILFAAAWFHDTGHLFTEPARHEEKSVEIMRNFMQENTTDEALIKNIEQCIMVTKMPRNPANLLQQIICDADTYHLGTKAFKLTNGLMFEELNLSKPGMDKTTFDDKTLEMLETHQFYTDYCKELLNKKKKKNMKKLKKKNSDKNENLDQIPVTVNPGGPENLSNIEKDKTGLMSKGIQTMLRLTSENHLKLSDMADHKANILISVNAIIISVILSVLFRKLQDEPYLTVPSIIFLGVAVSTIVIAILATRPKIIGGTFTNQDITDKKTNLLFFGNFYKASFEDYNIAMRNMMVDTDYLYGSLIKDIYSLGIVLGRKYRLVRLAYNIFMIGIVISVVAFALAVSINHSSPSAPAVTNAAGSPF
ncbi:MAG: Pycsar system effector family protein [Ginsengibacter sp.]